MSQRPPWRYVSLIGRSGRDLRQNPVLSGTKGLFPASSLTRHDPPVTRLGPLVASLALTLLLGACEGDVPPAGEARSSVRTEGVLYDGAWVVEEGVWFLGDPERYAPMPDRAVRGQANGLLGAQVRGVLGLNVPGLYGKYRTRVELFESEPEVPSWCEDVVEVPFRSAGEIAMGSFEYFEPAWHVQSGTYRVRECVTGLDQAATEEEFDGDDYHTYTGRHLLQLWPAPLEPDEVVRVGSRWAERRHRRTP